MHLRKITSKWKSTSESKGTSDLLKLLTNGRLFVTSWNINISNSDSLEETLY